MDTTVNSNSNVTASPRGGACPCSGAGDWIDTLFWSAGLLWGALVLLGSSTGLTTYIVGLDAWSIFLGGLAVIVLITVAIREIAEVQSRSRMGALLFALFLLALAAGGGAEWIWAVVLAAVALALLESGQKRREEVASSHQSARLHKWCN